VRPPTTRRPGGLTGRVRSATACGVATIGMLRGSHFVILEQAVLVGIRLMEKVGLL
jgi:hypothetical protein